MVLIINKFIMASRKGGFLNYELCFSLIILKNEIQALTLFSWFVFILILVILQFIPFIILFSLTYFSYITLNCSVVKIQSLLVFNYYYLLASTVNVFRLFQTISTCLSECTMLYDWPSLAFLCFGIKFTARTICSSSKYTRASR